MQELSDNFVIILAAGLATRLKPLSNRIPKPLIEINGITIIKRLITTFKDAGFTNFCILKGYMGELVEQEVKKITKIKIEFVEQIELSGMADAISLCIDHLNKKYENVSNFLVSAGDILLTRDKIFKCYTLYKKSKADILLSLMKSRDVEIAKGHGNVKISEENDVVYNLEKDFGFNIIDIVEKPKTDQILGEYYSLPFYIFNRSIVKYISEVGFSERGEKEFQDAIKLAILNGKIVRGLNILQETITIENIGKYHLTTLEDILKMNFKYLKGIQIEGESNEFPTIIEPVHLKKNIRIGDNVLIGPNVIIDERCQIEDNCEFVNTIIFNHVIIGKNVKLAYCLVDEKIELPNDFKAKNCFITYEENKQKEIKLIKF